MADLGKELYVEEWQLAGWGGVVVVRSGEDIKLRLSQDREMFTCDRYPVPSQTTA